MDVEVSKDNEVLASIAGKVRVLTISYIILLTRPDCYTFTLAKIQDILCVVRESIRPTILYG